MFAGTNTAGGFRSTDSGLSWLPANTGLYSVKVVSLAFYAGEVFAGTSNGVYRTPDGGTTWPEADSGLPRGSAVSSFFVQDSLLFAGTGGAGVFRSSDDGTSWAAVNNGLGNFTVNVLTGNRDTLYAGTQTGQSMYRSLDHGASWTATNIRLYAGTGVQGAAMTGGYVFAGRYAGGLHGGVFRSSDGGASWDSVSNGISDPWVHVLLAVDTVLYCGTQHGFVYRSTDYGANWTDVSAGLPGHPITSLAAAGNYLFAGTAHATVYRSLLAAPAWSQIGEGLSDDYVYSLAVGSTDLFAGTSHASAWRRPLTDLIPISTGLQVYGRWNLMSIPLAWLTQPKTVLFPTAISQAFSFDGGYVVRDTLSHGTGYWLKFSDSGSVSLTGIFLAHDSVVVRKGWNMVGSLSSAIPASSITSVPPGMVMSNFFRYEDSYVVADTIEPGVGYWVKTDQAGAIVLSGSSSSGASGRIRIVPTAEMPPPPPQIVDANRRDIPLKFELGQNYPNPFNPTTEIRFTLPRGGFTTLRVYDVLGRQVAALVDEVRPAGAYSVRWDASTLPSGVYFCKLRSGNFQESRKMLLLR